jgi:aminotransferase in exopolysaccharide biosynthesis
MSFEKVITSIRKSFPGHEIIHLHQPVFRGNEKKYIVDAIDSTFVSSIGVYVDQFEMGLAAFTRTSKAVAVVNGTAAIQVALRLVGVRANDEVITQALTFVATANAIAYNSAFPVFVDVERDTMGMSPDALKLFLEEFGDLRSGGCYNKSTGRKIAACLPMHTFGYMCRIDEIVRVCEEWNIPVIEDAAEALGSLYKEKPAGSFGKMAAFSFNGNKIITAGGGGAIVSSDSTLAEKAKYLTTTAKIPHQWEYVHDELGFNFRMPNINAALLCAQLEQLNEMKSSKKRLYEEYQSFFDQTEIQLKSIPDHTDWNYWLMSVELENRHAREAFLKETNSAGVITRPIWELMYRLPMYDKCQRDEQQNAEYLADRIVNIPSSAR